jgi:hypothetical protein
MTTPTPSTSGPCSRPKRGDRQGVLKRRGRPLPVFSLRPPSLGRAGKREAANSQFVSSHPPRAARHGSFWVWEIGLHENEPPPFLCKPTASQLQTNRKPIRKSLALKPFGHLPNGPSGGGACKPKGPLEPAAACAGQKGAKPGSPETNGAGRDRQVQSVPWRSRCHPKTLGNQAFSGPVTPGPYRLRHVAGDRGRPERLGLTPLTLALLTSLFNPV